MIHLKVFKNKPIRDRGLKDSTPMTARISVQHVLERAIAVEVFNMVCKIQNGVVLMQRRADLVPVKFKTKTRKLLVTIFLVFPTISFRPPVALVTQAL